jgi:hypothetical protein
VRLEVTEALLNRVSGSRAGIVGVYHRRGWDQEKAEALRAWARHVLDCAEGREESGNVVELPSPRVTPEVLRGFPPFREA